LTHREKTVTNFAFSDKFHLYRYAAAGALPAPLGQLGGGDMHLTVGTPGGAVGMPLVVHAGEVHIRELAMTAAAAHEAGLYTR
jgi:hypothetical protein